MNQLTISPSMRRAFFSLTNDDRLDTALAVAIKELIRFKLQEAEERARRYQTRYQMDFDQFKRSYGLGQFTFRHTNDVERDCREWELAVEDSKRLTRLLAEL